LVNGKLLSKGDMSMEIEHESFWKQKSLWRTMHGAKRIRNFLWLNSASTYTVSRRVHMSHEISKAVIPITCNVKKSRSILEAISISRKSFGRNLSGLFTFPYQIRFITCHICFLWAFVLFMARAGEFLSRQLQMGGHFSPREHLWFTDRCETFNLHCLQA
jgi:hypothetical protein